MKALIPTMKLHFHEAGDGEPLILLHGLLGSHHNLLPQAESFASRFRVFALDHRNHGASPHADEFDYDVMAADVMQFMYDQNISRARVIGHSMEDGIPDGSYCLFRAFEAGAAPSAIALDGRRVIVELRDGEESDLGGRYTLKRWRVAKLDPEGGVVEIELRPDNRSYRAMRMRSGDGEIREVAEMLEVLE